MTLSRKARGAVLPLAVLLLWSAWFAFGHPDARIVASPRSVILYFIQAIERYDLWIDLSASLARVALGFAAGSLAGVVTGVILSLSPTVRDALLPSINSVKQVSIFAWVPLISIWFGLGEGARLFVIAASVWFPVLFNTLEGVASIPREFFDLPRVYGFSSAQKIRRLILPAALPSIFTGLYVGLVMSWMVTLGAEYMLTSTRGLGHMLLDARDNFRMDQLLVGVLVIGAVGFAIHALGKALERRLLGWRGSSNLISL